jgi:hypothetical protein
VPNAVARRRLAALGAVAAAATVVGASVGAGHGDKSSADPGPGRAASKPRPQLPGGGRTILPGRRVVAFYGNPRDRELGELGIGTPLQAARRLVRQARPYARPSRPVLPALELISTVATAAPGPDGLYRDHASDAMIRRYLRAARRIGGVLVLDIQPGRESFGPEVERLARWLREPDVGLALDAEWHVGPGDVPGRVIGNVDAEVVNATAAYLSNIVRDNDLPQKLLLVHRFTFDMISRDDRLRPYPGVASVVNVDGFGSQVVKVAKYRAFQARTPRLRRGFKLFYKEDLDLMRPAEVLRMRPRPDVVVYE